MCHPSRSITSGSVALGQVRVAAGQVREADGGRRPSPGILCWNCRTMTPFDEDRCQQCGAAFAGGTGGAYATSRIGRRPGIPAKPERAEPARSLSDLLRDLGRVHDVSSSIRRLDLEPREATLFQCPSCGRLVGEDARNCACGVRFASSEATFECPECESLVPTLGESCPVCGVRFEEAPQISYSCPKCGTPVASDALRCPCGVWFED